MASSVTRESVLRRLGVPRLVNASGIYTDLGGACLSPAIWESIGEVNASFSSLPDLLDRSGEQIAALVGAEAARVVPGASAGIALMVAACIARGDGTVSEQLPGASGCAGQVLLQRGHRYNYARCVALGGGTVVEVGTESGTSADELNRAIGPDTCAILFPAHLGGKVSTLPLQEVVALAEPHRLPVLVDAAYMSYPLELISSYTDQGADLACFSAKYFYGPNSGGFILGTSPAIADVRAVDFTEYESGPFRNFGRALKMDRTTVVATWLALEAWLAMDHETRWAEYAVRVERIDRALADLPSVTSAPCCYTLDDRIAERAPVNALALRASGAGPAVDTVVQALAAGDPWVRCSQYDGALVVCVETVAPEDEEYLIERLRAAWSG